MNNPIQHTILSICLLILFHVSAAANTTNDYLKFHSDIQVAIKEADMKRAKSIVKTLLPILDEDIEYTAMLIADEDDAYFLEELNRKYSRQKEIRQSLEDSLKKRKAEVLSKESMNMIRELRRLSLKPKER